MESITSLTNPFIKSVVALHDAKGRKEQGLFLADGVRICTTLLASKISLHTLLVTEPFYEQGVALAGDRCIRVSQKVMEKVSPQSSASGILGIFEIPEPPAIDTLSSGLVMAGISDPGNMGTLFRTAVAFGVHSVVVVGGADPYNPKVVQASAGTLGMVSLFEFSWETLEKEAHEKGLTLAALVMKGGESPAELDAKKALLIVGSEAHGIPTEWFAHIDQKITLPMPGGTESLNAALAAGIALYWGWIKS